MKRIFVFCGWLALCGAAWLGVINLGAAAAPVQTPAQLPAQSPTPAPAKPQPTPQPLPNLPLAQLQREFKTLPFKPGEKLVYEVKFNRFPIAAKVGEVTFEYVEEAEPGPTLLPQSPNFTDLKLDAPLSPTERYFRFRASAVSKGILIALFGVDVNNRYETLVARQNFETRLHFREIQEGKKRQAQGVFFDAAAAGVSYKWRDLTKPEVPPKSKVLPRADGMLDLLSAFFFVRLQRLKEGELLRFPVSDDAENYTFNIVIGKKEKLKTDCGKLNTLRIEPKLFGPGQIFGRQGELTMWLTADKTHVPVKLVAKTPSGTVSARLLNFKANCSIVEPSKEELEQLPAKN